MISTTDAQRAVNDLLWAINSPSLLNDSVGVAPLERGDFDQERLAHTIAANPNRRVGKYFEHLIRFWLAEIRGVTDLEHSRQIRDVKRTIGELDFLYTDEQGRRTHLEIAVKFYLHTPDADVGGSHFIGPNAADTFDRKMSRLFDHQLPLGRQHISGITQTIAIVKGRIFYHPNNAVPRSLPAKLSPDHGQGNWIRQSETRCFQDQPSDSRFCVLRKPHWLANEIAAIDDDSLMSKAGIADCLERHFQQNNHPVLVSQLEMSRGHYEEANRLFVVNDEWPVRSVSSPT
ncbi:DUF1853 family protein [Stieleria marina]|uniref:DUF1853 domain-containing protein n=1 Tax=Stieleria marina TaxID=1930275 RepID=A0A517P3G0_9BACT|nr:hypothetical protein K239x_59180 [Planctomycetes bacterium K23_9]